MFNFLLTSIILILFNQLVSCEEKFWLSNLEWEKISNWKENQLPDSNNRVRFPLEQRHSVSLPFGDVKLAGIDLSWDGLLALKQTGKVEIYDFHELSGKVCEWSKQGALFWSDPKNWKYSSEAIPHLLRVPCSSDVVIFPKEDNVLSIELPVTDIQVSAIQISGHNFSLTKWEWWNCRKKREFVEQKFSISYSNNKNCQGCPCQDKNENAYLEEVCDIQRSRCEGPICLNSLKVEGHCCDFCGGRIIIINNVFIPKIQRITKAVLNQFEHEIDWYVRKKSNGETEILLTEKNSYNGFTSKKAIDSLNSYLKDETNILVGTVEYSGEAVKKMSWLVSLGPIFGSLFMIIILLLVTFKVSGYSYSEILGGCHEFRFSVQEAFFPKTGKIKSFNFARFENVPEGNVQLTRPTSMENDQNELITPDNEDQSTSGSRFENPLYRSKRSGKKKEESEMLQINEPMSMSVLQNNERDNQNANIEMKIDM